MRTDGSAGTIDSSRDGWSIHSRSEWAKSWTERSRKRIDTEAARSTPTTSNRAGRFPLASSGALGTESARMAPRLAIRPIPRLFVAVAWAFGLLAGSLPRAAHAQSAVAPAPSTDSAEVLGSAPSVTPDEYPPPSARTNLLIAGGVTTASWYALALGSSYLWPDTVGANDLRIPVAGPWMALSHSGCGNVSDCSKVIVVIRAIATTIDAIGQASGLAIAAEGLFLPTQEPKRKRAELKLNGVELHPTFDAGKNTVGFGVLGVF